MRREVVRGRPGRRRHQHPIADQLGQPHAPIDRDADLGSLPQLPQQRHLVERHRFLDGARRRHGMHAQRMQQRRLRPAQAPRHVVLVEPVHHEPDRAAIHAINGRRQPARQQRVQRFQHEAVPAERHDHLRGVERAGAVPGDEPGERGAGVLRRRRRKGDARGRRREMRGGDHGDHGRA